MRFPPPRSAAEEADSFTEDTVQRPRPSVGYLYGLGDHALSADHLARPVESGAGAAACAIHGAECDGVATQWAWTTEEMRRGRGFVEEVPMVDAGGRIMVEWAELLEEAVTDGGRQRGH